jgi:hypothetical protein
LYPNFAREARAWVVGQRTNRRTDEMAALNGATQAAVESLQTQFLEVKLEYKEYRRTTDLQMQVLIRNQNLILQVLNSLPNRLATTLGNGGPPPPPPQAAAAAAPPPPPPSPPPTPQQPTNLHGENEEGKDDVDDGAPPLEEDEEEAPQQQAPVAAPAAAAAPPAADRRVRSNRQGLRSVELRQALNDNALAVINAQAVQPACDQKRPIGYRKVLNEWKANDYDAFRLLEPAVKKRWAHKARFNSRVQVMEEIERLQRIEDHDRAPALPACTLEEAADLLDHLFGLSPLCFSKHLAERRLENPDVGIRNRGPNNPLNPLANPPAARGNFFQPRGVARGVARVDDNGGARTQARRTRTQERPPALPDDRGDAFMQEFGHVQNPQSQAALARERFRHDQMQMELDQNQAAHWREQERVRTQGALLYRNVGEIDQRNHNGMGAYDRRLYAQQHLNQL